MRYFDENGPYWGNTSEQLVQIGNDRLTARSVKIFADGALRSGGAAVRVFTRYIIQRLITYTAIRTVRR